MPANAAIGEVKPPSTEAFGSNIPYAGLDWRSQRDPDYLIYLFNISRRTFTGVGRIGKSGMTIPGVTENDPTDLSVPEIDPKTKKVRLYKPVAGKANEKYHYVTSLPQPFLMAKFNDEAGTIAYVETDVRRVAVDLIDPDNLGLTLDSSPRPENRFSIGTNLAEKGVFFSYNNPPTVDDVQKARARMEAYYNRLLEEAAVLELTDKTKLSEQLRGNPDYAFAAEYFGKDVTWNKRQVRPTECPNCGEQKPAGRKFHVTSFGSLCVEQTVEAWKSAVNSGVKRYEDVPDDFQWKKAVTAVPQKSAIPTT